MGQAHAWICFELMPESATNTDLIRHAATMILVRHINGIPHVLMGQRGANAAFMPMKFVFPGGAVDQDDENIPLAEPLAEETARHLKSQSLGPSPEALVCAAIRELWEEAGFIFGQKRDWNSTPPDGWKDFAQTGHKPTAKGLKFIFRAITPKGRPRRFDARFFMASADTIKGDLDDFSRAEDELSHLNWVALHRARELDLPFITEVVLAEVAAHLKGTAGTAGVPFFDNTKTSGFLRL